MDEVCVSGIGCVCAAGENVAAALDSMLAGRRNAAPPCHFTADHQPLEPVFAVTAALDGYSSAVAPFVRTAALARYAAVQAINHCGWELDELRSRRVGVIVGTTVGSSVDIEAFYRAYRGGETPSLTAIDAFWRYNPAAAIQREFSFTGPAQTLLNACSSGTDAIGIGKMWLEQELCDIVLAGGADELCRTTYNGFAALQISSTELCRPFSGDRKGLNLGEGAALLVLERRSSCQHRGATVRGVVRGYGSGSDAWHLTAPHSDGRGLRRALDEAFAAAALTAADIDFINTHGTGTSDNDRVECAVIAATMAPEVPFISTKGYTGHTLGAAGAIEAALTLESLRRGVVPASAGFTCVDDRLPRQPLSVRRNIDATVALSQSLAFGGNNAVLILQRGDE